MKNNMHKLNKNMLELAIDDAISIVRRNMKKWGNKIPVGADAGVYKQIDINASIELPGAFNWAVGCGPGIYWLCYAYTKDESFSKTALEISDLFKNIEIIRSQCQGILYMPVCMPAYRDFGSEKAKEILLKGADTLMDMFEPGRNYFRAWKDIKNFSVDSIINICIMHWASQMTGDSKYYDAALKHIDTEIELLVRSDGSTYNLADFDDKGVMMGYSSNHLLTGDGCWSRGHAWAMYGFAMHYKFTGKQQFLDCYKKLASYFLGNLDDGFVPCWDLKLSNTGEAPDTSAAAIAVCSILEMSRLLPDDKMISGFKQKADLIMYNLIKNFSVAYDNYIDALMLGGTYNIQANWCDEALIFGDYFYLEALVRYLKDDYESCWQ